MAKPPRLQASPLTKTAYILTSYDEMPDGFLRAKTKHPVVPRDLLDVMYVLGISEAALYEVARVLGFTKKAALNAPSSPEDDDAA